MLLVIPPPRIAPWTLSRRTRMGSYRVFDVDKVGYADGAGRDRGDFFVFTCPDWCNVVGLTDEGNLVLVWQYRFGTDEMALETPGGVLEPGEAPEAAARRELLEETGYEAREIVSLGSSFPNPALEDNTCHFFFARCGSTPRPPSPDDQEEVEVSLVPATSAAALIDEGHVRHVLCVAALERCLRRGLLT